MERSFMNLQSAVVSEVRTFMIIFFLVCERGGIALICDDIRLAKVTSKPRFDKLMNKEIKIKRIPRRENKTKAKKV